MDEQTTQEQEFSSYEEQPQEDVQEPEGFEEPDYSDELDGEDPEISVKDGEVKFSDDFFGDLPDEPQDEQPQAPNYYTDEELENTPYERWDVDRMPEEVKRYVKYFNSQTTARQQQYQYQQQVAQRPQTPPFFQEVKQYTPQELSQEAEKLAIERLGLDDPDDFDVYESEHTAALNIAMQELAQKRNAEVSNYQRQAREWNELQQFNASLASRPDFGEYREWFNRKAQSEGTSAQALNKVLSDYAQSSGDFTKVQQAVAGWYQMFLNEKAQDSRGSRGTRKTQRPQRPPVLEGTRGGGYEGKRSVNLQNFGELDSDAQARALMDLGIV